MKRCLSWMMVSVVLLVLSVIPAFADNTVIEVSELVTNIKNAIISAQNATLQKPRLRVKEIELEISYVVKKEGSGGFKMYVVTADGKYGTEVVHRLKFQLEPEGKQYVQSDVPVEGVVVGVDSTAGKIFVRSEGEGESEAAAVEVKSDTKITDLSGNKKTLCDVKAGTTGKFIFGLQPDGTIDVKSITLGR